MLVIFKEGGFCDLQACRGMHLGYIPPSGKRNKPNFQNKIDSLKASVQRMNIYYTMLRLRNVATSCDKYFNGV